MSLRPAGPSTRKRRSERQQLKHDVLLGLMSGLPLTIVARRNGTSQTTVDRWAKDDPEFAEEIAAARSLGWDSLAVECLDIIDDRSDDVMYDTDGTAHPNGAAVLRAKARCEVRLKLLSKWDSGRYADPAKLEISGQVAATVRHVIDPRSLDDAGRAALRHLVALAQQGLAPPDAIDAEYEEIDEGDEA